MKNHFSFMLKLAAFFILFVGTICGSSLSAMAESPSSSEAGQNRKPFPVRSLTLKENQF